MRGQNAGHAILENRDGEIGHALYHHTTISRGFKDDRYTFVIHHEQDNKTLPLEAVLIDDEKYRRKGTGACEEIYGKAGRIAGGMQRSVCGRGKGVPENAEVKRY